MGNLAPKPHSRGLPVNKAAMNLALCFQNTQATKMLEPIIEMGSFAKPTPAAVAAKWRALLLHQGQNVQGQTSAQPISSKSAFEAIDFPLLYLSQGCEAQDESSTKGLALTFQSHRLVRGLRVLSWDRKSGELSYQ